MPSRLERSLGVTCASVRFSRIIVGRVPRAVFRHVRVIRHAPTRSFHYRDGPSSLSLRLTELFHVGVAEKFVHIRAV
jgi:hypothetical protein